MVKVANRCKKEKLSHLTFRHKAEKYNFFDFTSVDSSQCARFPFHESDYYCFESGIWGLWRLFYSWAGQPWMWNLCHGYQTNTRNWKCIRAISQTTIRASVLPGGQANRTLIRRNLPYSTKMLLSHSCEHFLLEWYQRNTNNGWSRT